MRYPREINARPTWRLTLLIAAIHMVAAISFVHLDPAAPWVYTGASVVGLSFALCLRAARRQCSSRLVLEDSGALRVLRGELEHRACPQSSCVDFGWAVWLVWAVIDTGRKCNAVLILRWDVPADEWRALRIWLRHKAPQGAANEVSEA